MSGNGIWTPHDQIEALNKGRSGLKVYTSHESTIICPPTAQMWDSELRWGTHLDGSPAALERTIIQTVFGDRSVARLVKSVNLYYNKDPFGHAEDGTPLQLFLVAYRETPMEMKTDAAPATRQLLERAKLASQFKQYGVVFVGDELAQRLGYPMDKVTYSTRTLTFDR